MIPLTLGNVAWIYWFYSVRGLNTRFSVRLGAVRMMSCEATRMRPRSVELQAGIRRFVTPHVWLWLWWMNARWQGLRVERKRWRQRQNCSR